MTLMEDALEELRKGNFVLVHDSAGRENETDMVLAAERVLPEHIARMRTDAGGLICVALGRAFAEKLELPYLSDICELGENKYPLLSYLRPGKLGYDAHSAFSISVNHRKTFTGISDTDRALTVSELGAFARDTSKEANRYVMKKEFGNNFRSEGHVHLLISSGLGERKGHTELSMALMDKAGLAPAAAICEMLDSTTHKALQTGEAIDYAKRNGLVYLEGADIIKEYKKD